MGNTRGKHPWEKSLTTTERIFAAKNFTDHYGADIRPWICHGAERIFSSVSEWSGADIRLRGKSRIVTERISAAANVTDDCGANIRGAFFFHGAIYLNPSSKRTKPRHLPTVHRSHYP